MKVIKSEMSEGFDLTASQYIKKVKHSFEKNQDFVESGLDEKDGWWFITNCGDNCLKIYPEGLIL